MKHEFLADEKMYIRIGRRRLVSTVPVIPELAMALGLLAFVFIVTYFILPNDVLKHNTQDTFVTEVLPEQYTQTFDPSNIFDEITLSARSAIVWDIEKKQIIFNKNADEQLPLASVTKLMTALVAYELLDTTEKIRITEQAIKTEGDSGFTENEEFTMQNLVDLVLITSSNDGAVALGTQAGNTITDTDSAEKMFVHAMNIKAKDIGLTKTVFKNATGLDITSTEAGAYGSARDMAFLIEHIIQTIPDAITRTTFDSEKIKNENGMYHTTENTNEIVDEIDGLLVSKTGYTDLAGGNLVIAFNAGLNRPIAIAILGSTYHNRFSDMLTLVHATQKYLATE
jgi:serine-type D-Ala-D-Ala carboxypeptidase (penicillin-binding protein 5/6)